MDCFRISESMGDTWHLVIILLPKWVVFMLVPLLVSFSLFLITKAFPIYTGRSVTFLIWEIFLRFALRLNSDLFLLVYWFYYVLIWYGNCRKSYLVSSRWISGSAWDTNQILALNRKTFSTYTLKRPQNHLQYIQTNYYHFENRIIRETNEIPYIQYIN